jgi:hypothetical protein
MGSGLALQYVTHYNAFQAATLEKCVITRSDPFISPLPLMKGHVIKCTNVMWADLAGGFVWAAALGRCCI